MSRWTSDQSALLSLLLDGEIGTKETIEVRKDYCRLTDCIFSNSQNFTTMYWTGSKSEGLDLPGSDMDFMADANDVFGIKVIQSLRESHTESSYTVLYMCTENTPPGFALLRCITPVTNIALIPAFQSMNGLQYLSSDLMVDLFSFSDLNQYRPDTSVLRKSGRQGPSVEVWSIYDDITGPGTDNVFSIHCPFWPKDALEWHERPRPFGWPTPHDVSSIVNFGFHLVGIGHPQSRTRLLEWRLSFSLAERTLVWSFNHTQMQCYAVMKIILKEFIKKKCSPQNQVLCSYFIKTFLFWKYETEDLGFWQENNLKECIMYLLAEFHECLHKGVIPHYFIPRFNLLSVKLTPEAKTELLQLFDSIIKKNISFLRECRTLKNVWANFLSADKNQMSIIHNQCRTNLLNNDKCIMTYFRNLKTNAKLVTNIVENEMTTFMMSIMNCTQHERLFFEHVINDYILCRLQRSCSLEQFTNKILTLQCKTCLKSLVIKYMLFEKYLRPLKSLCQGNKDIYCLHQITAHKKSSAFDISTCKLWYAIIILKKQNYDLTLGIVDEVLQSIPPFAFYMSCYIENQKPTEKEHLYTNYFCHSEISTMQRARKAWLCGLTVEKENTEIMPLAIQIELYFCDANLNQIILSPLICLYYLMFLCYHELRLYDKRDCTLRQLVVANSAEKYGGHLHHSLNIAGHCMLVAGEIDGARDMFLKSYQCGLYNPPYDKYNSAQWYLQHFC